MVWNIEKSFVELKFTILFVCCNNYVFLFWLLNIYCFYLCTWKEYGQNDHIFYYDCTFYVDFCLDFYQTWLHIRRMMSYKNQELLTFCEHHHPPPLFVICVAKLSFCAVSCTWDCLLILDYLHQFSQTFIYNRERVFRQRSD